MIDEYDKNDLGEDKVYFASTSESMFLTEGTLAVSLRQELN